MSIYHDVWKLIFLYRETLIDKRNYIFGRKKKICNKRNKFTALLEHDCYKIEKEISDFNRQSDSLDEK